MKKTINPQINQYSIFKKDIFLSLDNFISSNATHSTTIIVPHVCNNVDVFGGGFTSGIVQHYPIVRDNYHMLGPSFLQKNLGYTQFILAREHKKNNNQIIFANMIAQNGTISPRNKRPLNYLALCRSMLSVSKYIKETIKSDQSVQIHAPKFGSGLAGGNWSFISDLISDMWGDFQVFIYDINKKT
jgi:hypothetical protein